MPDLTRIDWAIGRNVAAEMTRYELNQQQIADLLGIGQSNISDRLNAHTSFKARELAIIADHLHIPVARLYEGVTIHD